MVCWSRSGRELKWDPSRVSVYFLEDQGEAAALSLAKNITKWLKAQLCKLHILFSRNLLNICKTGEKKNQWNCSRHSCFYTFQMTAPFSFSLSNLVSFKYIILYRLKRLEFHEAVQTPSSSLPMWKGTSLCEEGKVRGPSEEQWG